MPWERYLILLAVVFVGIALRLKRIGVALPGTEVATRFSFLKLFFSQLIPLALFVLYYLAVAVAIGTPLSMLLTARNFDRRGTA
jgi:hypothetical protein